MSKYYYGFFRSTDTSKDPNGQLYKVVIITDFANLDINNINDKQELTLSGQPFVVEYANDEENIYKPYKCSTATVSFYQRKFNLDFQTSSGNSIFVQLLKLKDGYNGEIESIVSNGFTVEWCGFATPNTYSQSYELEEDLFQLECQDGLSVLQYYKYERTGAGIVSFLDIILKWAKFLRCYKTIYITDAVYVPLVQQRNIIEAVNIKEQNFFDEDGEADDMLSILENMFRYLSLTCVPFQDKLYILNYDAIRNGYYAYDVWRWSDETYTFIYQDGEFKNEKEKVELKDERTIYKEDFASNGTTLSMVGTYNNLKIKCDIYPLGDSIVDINDKNNTIRSKIYQVNSKTHAAEYPGTINLHKDEKTNALIRYLKLKPIQNKGFINKITFHWYDRDNADGTFNYTELDPQTIPFQDNPDGAFGDTSTGDNFIYTTRYVGAGIMQYDYQKTNDDAFDLVNFQNNHKIKYNTAFAIYQNSLYKPVIPSVPSELSSNFIIPQSQNQKMISFYSDAVIIDSNDKISISGKFRMFPNTHGLPTVDPLYNSYIKEELCSVECVLRYGNLYFTGSQWKTKDPNQQFLTFPLQIEYKENTWMYDNDLSVINTNVISRDGEEIKDVGFIIPAPPISEHPRELEFSICRPYACGYFENYRYSRFCGLTLISDFSIDIITDSQVFKLLDDSDNNVEYSAIVQTDSVTDASDVDLNISTYTYKKTNWSSPWYNNDGFQYLQSIGNKATGEIGLPEFHIINNIITEYKNPAKVFNLSLHNRMNVKPYSLLSFTSTYSEEREELKAVVDCQVIDYANDTNTLTLVQKV